MKQRIKKYISALAFLALTTLAFVGCERFSFPFELTRGLIPLEAINGEGRKAVTTLPTTEVDVYTADGWFRWEENDLAFDGTNVYILNNTTLSVFNTNTETFSEFEGGAHDMQGIAYWVGGTFFLGDKGSDNGRMDQGEIEFDTNRDYWWGIHYMGNGTEMGDMFQLKYLTAQPGKELLWGVRWYAKDASMNFYPEYGNTPNREYIRKVGTNGEVKATFHVPGDKCSGLAAKGDVLYMALRYYDRDQQKDYTEIFLMSTTTYSFIGRTSLGLYNIDGLVHDGRYIWLLGATYNDHQMKLRKIEIQENL